MEKIDNQQQEKTPEFLKYDSIKCPNLKTFQKVYHKYKKQPVYITEKIHGANMQVILDTKKQMVKLGKRTTEISEWIPKNYEKNDKKLEDYLNDPSFFQKQVIQAFGDQWNKIWEFLENLQKNEFPEAESIYLYGELFGGLYGEEGEIKFIQKEIQYCKDFKYWVFDIMIGGKARLPPTQFYDLIQKYKIDYSPYYKPLQIGVFEDFFNLNSTKFFTYEYKDFMTTIPEQLGYTEPIENNFSEGVVMKFSDVVWKIKSEKFFEIRKEPVPKQTEVKNHLRINKNKLSTNKEFKEKFDQFLAGVTFPRLQNVMLKEGNQASLETAKKNIIEDILQDLKEMEFEYPEFEDDLKEKQTVFDSRMEKMYESYMKKLK